MNETLLCLVCGKSLQGVSIDTIVVDACLNGCGGIWFDQAELTRLNTPNKGGDDSILETLLTFPRTESLSSAEKRCPRCQAKLRPHSFRGNSGILIDECYGCGGIWLDGGELKAIRENPVAQKAIQDQKSEALSKGIISPGFKEQQELERIRRIPIGQRTASEARILNQQAQKARLGNFFVKLFTG